MKNYLFSGFLLLFATVSFAQENYDVITDEYFEYMEYHFSGSTSSSSKTWDHRSCILRNPLNGNCTQWVGDQTRGEAKVTVGNNTHSSGFVYKGYDPFGDGTMVKGDAVMEFHYQGASIGRKYASPSGAFIGHAWGWLHSEGKIKIHFVALANTKYQVTVTYEVFPGNPDRPNELVKAAAENLKSKAAITVRNYLNGHGIQANVEVR